MPRSNHKIIDSHQHVFWHGRNDAGLVADLDEHGIEYAWLLTREIAPFERVYPRFRETLNPLNARADGTHAVRFLTQYQDRLLFGRDGSSRELHQFLQSLDRSDKVREQIYHRNAERLVKLPQSEPPCSPVSRPGATLPAAKKRKKL